ncbi:hypothetical protein CTZ27_24740 [Streptomyces griseocarneus]|nr:hypothetical protein CTZ27_24740 [Streptomyces griseocarneus]
MSAVPYAVPALGTGVLCLSGYVWYVPAALDLRAGRDRPVSRLLTAAACLAGWGTAALFAVALVTPLRLVGAAVLAAAGATVTVVLLAAAWLYRRREKRETRRAWRELRKRGREFRVDRTAYRKP